MIGLYIIISTPSYCATTHMHAAALYSSWEKLGLLQQLLEPCPLRLLVLPPASPLRLGLRQAPDENGHGPDLRRKSARCKLGGLCCLHIESVLQLASVTEPLPMHASRSSVPLCYRARGMLSVEPRAETELPVNDFLITPPSLNLHTTKRTSGELHR